MAFIRVFRDLIGKNILDCFAFARNDGFPVIDRSDSHKAIQGQYLPFHKNPGAFVSTTFEGAIKIAGSMIRYLMAAINLFPKSSKGVKQISRVASPVNAK